MRKRHTNRDALTVNPRETADFSRLTELAEAFNFEPFDMSEFKPFEFEEQHTVVLRFDSAEQAKVAMRQLERLGYTCELGAF